MLQNVFVIANVNAHFTATKIAEAFTNKTIDLEVKFTKH